MTNRGTLNNPRPTGFTRAFYRAPIWIYRAGFGFLMGRRFLMLEHVGRRSGKTRYTALEVVRHDREADTYVVCSGWGTRADWFRNIRKTPDVRVSSGFRRRQTARAIRLEGDAAARELCSYAERYPQAFRILVSRLVMGSDGPVNCAEAAAVVPVVALKVRQAGIDRRSS